jgi:hypothetical protein
VRSFRTECLIIAWLGMTAADITSAASAERVQATARPCPRYGPSFVRVPGSDVCVRLTGRVSGGIDARARRFDPAEAPPVAGRLTIDTRAESEYGPVRTFVRVRPNP